MHHYDFNIGDYRRRTAHLNQLEHGIYRSLIDTYYLEENPLCLDHAKVMRSHSIRTPEEVAAFEAVLADFFEETPDGYRHKHIEDELQKIYDKSEKARKAAKSRWRKKKAENREENAEQMHEGCERMPEECDGTENQSESDAEAVLPNTQHPTPNKDMSSASRCPVQQIVDVYNETVVHLPKVRVTSDKMKTHLKARWKENKNFQSVEKWKNLFAYCDQNLFLSGRREMNDDRQWTANLQWIVNPTNFAKIMNSNYDKFNP